MQVKDYEDGMSRCSHCGYCQAVCPVYQGEMLESLAPRNRMQLVYRAMVKKDMAVSPRLQEIIDYCLLCTSCTRNCPGQVPVDEIVIAARNELTHSGGIRKVIMNKMLKRRGLAGILGRAGAMVQRLGITSRDLPRLAAKPFEAIHQGEIAAVAPKIGRVAYFVGCGTNYLFPDTGEAVVKVLTSLGYDVIIPADIVCCGIPALAEGDLESAREMAACNIEALLNLGVDAIVTDCTSCGMMLKQKMAKLFAADDPLQTSANAVAARVWEVTDYLVAQGVIPHDLTLNCQCTYHVPCHHGWSTTVKEAPRTLSALIKGVNLLEMEEPEACCGAAGTYYFNHRELSNRIRSRKLQDITQTGAELVMTQCPVCRFYIGAGLDKKVEHPLKILAQALARGGQ
jgi:glycolate oxidase iron-sulfur subunit